MASLIEPSFSKIEFISRLFPFIRAIKTSSAILKASFDSFPFLIPNTQVQAPTPKALAIHSSLPISSQGNLKDSSIFLRSNPFSPSGKPAKVLIGEIKLISSHRRNNFFILVEDLKITFS